LDTRTSLLHKAQTAYRLLLRLPPPLVDVTLLGRPLRVREGAVISEIESDAAWLLACALRAEMVFDVGSNVGQAALIMLLSPSVRQITLIDPNPAALAIAAENLILNHLIQYARLVCTFADTADDQQVTLWTTGTGSAGSVYNERAHTAAKRNESMQVPTSTLDTLAAQFGVPDFIKIDIEGAEVRALEGARTIASHAKSRFLVEMHALPGKTMAQHYAMVNAWTDSVGYAAYHLRTHERLPLADVPEKRLHLLLQPIAWAYPEWLKVIASRAPLESISLTV